MAVYEWGTKPEAQDAIRQVNENLRKIEELYSQCAELAREHGFGFSYEGPAGYGDGGYFEPDDEDGHWQASSQSC